MCFPKLYIYDSPFQVIFRNSPPPSAHVLHPPFPRLKSKQEAFKPKLVKEDPTSKQSTLLLLHTRETWTRKKPYRATLFLPYTTVEKKTKKIVRRNKQQETRTFFVKHDRDSNDSKKQRRKVGRRWRGNNLMKPLRELWKRNDEIHTRHTFAHKKTPSIEHGRYYYLLLFKLHFAPASKGNSNDCDWARGRGG